MSTYKVLSRADKYYYFLLFFFVKCFSLDLIRIIISTMRVLQIPIYTYSASYTYNYVPETRNPLLYIVLHLYAYNIIWD